MAASLTTPAKAEVIAASHATLDVRIEKLNNDKGSVALVLCPADSGFPDCDARALRKVHLKIERGVAQARFTDLPDGRYAIAVYHDANGNNRMDKLMGIPREGYGFSRNPGFKPRAPRFDECVFDLSGVAQQTISIRYLF